MCDFFIFIQPKIQYEFSMWLSPEMREGRSSCPDDETSDAVIKILWFHM